MAGIRRDEKSFQQNRGSLEDAMKIVLLGAGSFVFGPSVIHDVIAGEKLTDVELALVDINPAALDCMAALARRLATATGQRVAITTHAKIAPALPGADFVLCAVAVQLRQRFERDCAIIRAQAPGHLISEFGGIQGISYSLRQVAMIEQVAGLMRLTCPNAWLLDSANPLPRVCQAAHECGIQTAGFCNQSESGYGLIWQAFHGQPEEYPWPQATGRYRAVMGGVNHLTWLVRLEERLTGREITADFLGRAKDLLAGTRTGELLAATGAWPTAGDAHMQDFLPPHSSNQSLVETSHGSETERDRRLQAIEASDWPVLLAHRSWEQPVKFIAALGRATATEFHSLNLVNTGQLPQLPTGVFVETPAVVTDRGPQPVLLTLPVRVAEYCRATAELTGVIVRAARERSRRQLRQAVELDPTITDKANGWQTLQACLQAHADILPRYE